MRTASLRLLPGQLLLLLAAALIGPSNAASTYDGSGIAAGLSNQLPSTQTCESRTVNYITHTLPQQCLRTNWSAPNSTTQADATAAAPEATATSTTVVDGGGAQPGDGSMKEESKTKTEAVQDEEELDAGFMSFEEWKAIQLKKQGQELAELQAKRRQERKAEEQANQDILDTLSDDGEIVKEFEALNDKVSELAAQAAHTAADAKRGDGAGDGNKAVEPVLYEDGNQQIYRSKEAGTTCKERFSFASHDAGATIKKTSAGAKNAKAILVENKDSYMLLTCGSENKFVIIELSEDILVDTIVLANFEFFSSMIRQFRVSVSARYPVKIDKWTDIGTFEARNSRDIQPFLVEHPGMWAKYIRIEFLTHYGNEYYCPVSLLRIHGTRMMDNWQEGGHDDDDDEVLDLPTTEQVAETAENTTVLAAEPVADKPTVAAERKEVGLSPWQPIFYGNQSNICWTVWEEDTTTKEPAEETASVDQRGEPTQPTPGETPASPTTPTAVAVSSGVASDTASPAAAKQSTASHQDRSPPPANASLADPAQRRYDGANGTTDEAHQDQAGQAAKPSSADPPSPKAAEKPQAAEKAKSQPSSQPNSKSSAGAAPPSSSSASTSSTSNTANTTKSRASTANSASPSSPPVQESFFKSVAKRLQLLESNTSLSLQYIEDQSLFLRDALAKMERRQLARVDSFLGALNATVLAELHTLRGQYDQLWQSTVIALDSQRDQSEREVLALSGRLSLLADEVVFQKRMAILQSCLLLACLVLVIFSRNGLLTGVPAGMPMYPPSSSPGGASSPPLSARYAASPNSSPMRNGNHGVRRAYVPRQMYPDKMLPLTPTSEFDSADAGSPPPPAPSITVESPGSSSLSYMESSGEAGLMAPKSMLSRESSLSLDDDSTPTQPDTAGSYETIEGEEQISSMEKEEEEEVIAEPEGLSTPRSAIAQLSGSRKPLPALPEDPVQ